MSLHASFILKKIRLGRLQAVKLLLKIIAFNPLLRKKEKLESKHLQILTTIRIRLRRHPK